LMDSGGNVSTWDLGAERLHGFAAGQILGKNFSCLYAPDDVDAAKPAADLRTAALADRSESEGWRLRQDGSRFWANVILTSLRDEEGEVRAYISVTRDITDRKRAEEELRALSTRLMNFQDQERRRIARELHDSEGQNLSVLLMSLSKLKRTCTTLDLNSQALLSESIELANQCLREIRTLSYLLHPPLLDEFGLISALQWYVEGFSERSGIAVTLDVCPDLRRLPPDVETSLFRLIQESLTNIHRHSGSQTALISLAHQDGHVQLSIQDQGRGMDTRRLPGAHATPGPGVGIASMRERVRELGGTLLINSSPQGTCLSVTLPLPPLAAGQTA
jgi:PAS domain S-box-containing protein